MMDYEHESRAYDGDYPARDERSMSPRGRRESPRRDRNRSASPGASRPTERPDDRRTGDDASERSARNGSVPEQATNTGTNLFVTGIHPRLTEDDVTRLFAKYGDVEKCQIMVDPHTKESRGFGFVKMTTLEQADSAKEGLQGEVFEGRTLSIEKARRNRPRTPTPGKYFGPPKRDDYRGPPRGGGRFGDDRRYGGGRGGYEDYDRGYSGGYRGGDRGDRYRSRETRDEYGPPRGVDRYASRDDRYGREDRYGGSGREDRRAPRESGYGYGDRDATASYSRAPAADAPVTGSETRGYGSYRDDTREDRGYRR